MRLATREHEHRVGGNLLASRQPPLWKLEQDTDANVSRTARAGELARVTPSNPPRIGLVLGAGGILGGAWLVGALHAIATQTGWDPGGADYIVGTSAGSMSGALLACGVPPWFLVAHSAGETYDGLTDARLGSPLVAPRSGDATFRLERSSFGLAPGSWRLALSSLARPHRYPPMAVVAGWLPKGNISPEPLKDVVRRVCPTGWSPHPQFWAVAFDYTAGRRVAFGRVNAPPAALPDAVAASCAVPGFYRPVDIDGRAYVDGCVYSTSNLDVLRTEPLDLVVALNPMSSPEHQAPKSIGEGLALAIRKAAGRRLTAEAQTLSGAGIEVLLIQPTVRDLDAMGSNLMASRRRHDVVRTAVHTMTRQLHDSLLGLRLGNVAAGDIGHARYPVGRPPTWREFHAAASERWSDVRAA